MMKLTSLLCLWLPFAIAAKSTYTPCNLCLYEASPARLAEIQLRLYTGPTVDNYTSVAVGDALDLLDEIDNSKPTAVYMHGWLGTLNLPSGIFLAEAYLVRGDHNILQLDWSDISHNGYTYAARSLEGVGFTLATVLNNLVARGLNTTGLHVVGHSMGAQICGYTGRFVNFTLPRITGLDPAGPLFSTLIPHLTATDAEVVDIIHTDMGGLGTTLQTGDSDFYPNGGTNVQPSCTIIPLLSTVCSHYTSVYYYIASLLNDTSLIGVKCDSYSVFSAGLCSWNPTAVMGYAAPDNASGRYYLRADVRTLDVKVGDDLATILAETPQYIISDLISIVSGNFTIPSILSLISLRR